MSDTISTVPLHFERFGEPHKPAIVILHGLYGSISNWRTIAKKLAGANQVLIVDMRNHGRSPWADSMDYPDMARDVATLCDSQNITSPVVIGHSMGGKTAMAMVQLNLLSVSRLAVVDIAPVSYPDSHGDEHKAFLQAMLSLDMTQVVSRQSADDILSAQIPSLGIRQFLLQNLIKTAAGYAWRLNLKIIQANLDVLIDYPELKSTDTKTLFVKGENSNYVASENYAAIDEQFTQSSISSVSDAGHWLHAEQPGKVLQLLRDFI